MGSITKKFEIRAPPSKVFVEISKPENWPVWSGFVKDANSDGPNAHWVYDSGGRKVESDTVVTELQQDKVYMFKQTSGFLKSGDTRFEIEPTQEGSTVTWIYNYELPYSYFGKLIDVVTANRTFEMLRCASEGLKSYLEAMQS